MAERAPLAERIAALRGRVLDAPPRPDREPAGVELFEAALRLLGSARPPTGEDDPIDVAIKEGLKRRLAWGDDERTILSDAAETARRLLTAARPELADPSEEIEVAVAVAEAGAAVGRVLALALARQVVRQRAVQIREERAEQRLIEAIEKQKKEIAEIAELLRRRG